MVEIIVLAVYALLILYALSQLNHWLKLISHGVLLRAIVDVLYILFALLPIGGCYLSDDTLKNAMTGNGNIWLGFLVYFGMCLVFFHIIRFFIWIFSHSHHKDDQATRKKHPWAGLFVLFMCVLVSLSLTTYGTINAHKIHTVKYNVTLSKKTAARGKLKIVLISDLHLDTNTYEDQLRAMVREINRQNADIVVIAGDTFSGSYSAVRDPDTYETILKGIRSKQGVYAVYGNHDVEEKLLCGFNVSRKRPMRSAGMEEFMTKAGITPLDDKTVFINGAQIVGRLDGEQTGTDSAKRASIASLTGSLDTKMPVLVIEHEPTDFKNLSSCGVDLVLSGHTHAGQFFPCTVAMPFISQNAYGLKSIHGVYSIVTSGAGYYGPPIRIGTHSEIAVINLNY